MNRLVLILVLAWLGVVIEVSGHLLSGSLAVLSDAIHSTLDTVVITALIAVHWIVERKGVNPKYTYGYHRLEPLSSTIASISIIVLSVYILVKAIERFLNPFELNVLPMFVAASTAFVVNLLTYHFLREFRGTHMDAARLHAFSDAAYSLAALVAAFFAYLGVTIVDVLIATFLSLYLILRGIGIFRSSIAILLDKSVVDVDAIRRELGLNIHDIHVWDLCSGLRMATLHVVVEEDKKISELDQIANKIKSTLARYGITHVTIQFERGECGDVNHRHGLREIDLDHEGAGHWGDRRIGLGNF